MLGEGHPTPPFPVVVLLDELLIYVTFALRRGRETLAERTTTELAMRRSMTLPLILLGAGAIACVAAGYSLWRQALPPAPASMPVAVVTGSSMVETLHGPTVRGTCEACGFPLRFAIESLPSVGDVLCPNCGYAIKPESLTPTDADQVVIASLAEIEEPSLGLLYVFAAPEGDGEAPIVKRVVAYQGWRVRIEGGDLFFDEGSPGPVRKDPEDEFFPRVVVHEEGASQNGRQAASSFWERESRGDRVAHEFRPRTVWARESLPTPVLDAYPSQAVERRRLNPVPDVWAVGDLRSDEPVDAEFVYRTDDRTFSLEVEAGGDWSLSVDDRTFYASVLPDWSGTTSFRFGLLDRQLFLVRREREAIIVPLDAPIDGGSFVPSSSPLAIVVPSDATLTIRRVERDTYYLPPAGMTEPWIEPKEGTRDGWFVLGDYPSYSIDSRHFGRLPRETILGKPLRPPVAERATE